jgi:serine/threonine protein kinase/Tfp pilus assembly protein PilF
VEPERWGRVKEAVNACLELKPEERKDGIRRACADDFTLMAEVETLLNSFERAGDFLEIPVTESLLDAEPEILVGQRIGNYQISAMIAQGGMGAVYKAVRADDQFQKQVAIKLIRGGFDSSFIVQRFKAERQILANFDQPNIARLLDGGTTADGRPYLVMEYVEGEPFDVYCDSRRLPTDERLRLFRLVCSAVQFAHQNLVIHRDLKPSNILVTADGTPKLLDFGIAKILDPQQAGLEDSPATTAVQMMTPEYASPEQFRGGPFTTATDVYSLGVVLYRLLTGRWPYRAVAHTQQEIARAICELEPEKPSAAIELSVNTETDWRRERPDKLRSRLKGDLDNILLKALRKEPERRYASVEQFSEDIRRFLTGLPVIARKDTIRYRASKFVTRNKAAVIAAVASLVLLVAAVIVSSWMAVRASRAEQEAREVNDFLQNDLLAQASANRQARPNTRPDPDLKVRTAVDRAAARIGDKFADKPLVEASIRQTIGDTYKELGVYPEAQRQLESTLQLRKRLLGDRNANTLATMNSLAAVYTGEGKYTPAEQIASQALDISRRVLGREHPDTLLSMLRLAAVYYFQGKYPQAESLESAALDSERRVLGEEHPETLQAMVDLAATYKRQGKYAQAEQLYTSALGVRKRVSGPEHPETLLVMNNLAGLYYEQGKYERAEPLYTAALDIRRRVLGEAHPDTLQSMSNMALLYATEGNYAGAEPLYDRTLELRRRVSGDRHISTLIIMNNLAELYDHRRKYAQAEALYRETLQRERLTLGEKHDLTLASMSGLADTYADAGQYAEAEALYLKSLDLRRRAIGEEHPDTLYTITLLGRTRLLRGNFIEAETALRQALTAYERNLTDSWRRYRCESLLGASLAGQKKFAEAEPLLLVGYRGMIDRVSTIAPWDRTPLQEAGERVIELYGAWGRPKEAASWRTKLAADSNAWFPH